MSSRRSLTVLQACVKRHGVHKGAVVAAWVAQWAIATADLGEVAGTARYAEWWAISERNAWRHRAAIREALGDDWQSVVARLARHVEERRSPRALMALPLSA